MSNKKQVSWKPDKIRFYPAQGSTHITILNNKGSKAIQMYLDYNESKNFANDILNKIEEFERKETPTIEKGVALNKICASCQNVTIFGDNKECLTCDGTNKRILFNDKNIRSNWKQRIKS